MKVLNWNVRGLGSPHKKALMKSIISSYDPDFIILTKTKLSSIKKSITKAFGTQKVSSGL